MMYINGKQQLIEQILEIERIQKKRYQNNKLIRYNTGEKIHQKQLAFHKCMKKNRWVFGGNRSGKTECGAVEVVYMARGNHPYRKITRATSGWVVSLSTQVQRDVAQSKILNYLNPEWIVDVSMIAGRKDNYANGVIDYILVKNVFGTVSKIGFKSCDQGREKFQGTSLDYVWFDEEPPYDIYSECRMRLLDTDGDIFATMTPLKGNPYEVWITDHFRFNEIGVKTIFSQKIDLGYELGKAGKVISFKDNIYVIREFGITKISRTGDIFTTTEEYRSNSKIHVNTVSVCADKMIFMTNNGLFYFTGYNVSRASINFMNSFAFNNAGAIAKALGDKYYLALKIDFDDDFEEVEGAVNNALIIIDANDFSCQVIRGVDVATMLPLVTEYFEKMLFTFNSGPVDKIGEISSSSALMDLPLLKYWASDRLVDDMSTKMFTKLIVNSCEDVEFKLILDDKTLSFITTHSGVSEFCFKEISKNINIEISSTSVNADVVDVEIEYYEG